MGMQLVTTIDSTNRLPVGANGDSFLPIMSPNGRYVLFASTANNLVSTNGDGPVPSLIYRPLNVFLRDRVNGVTSLVSVNLNGTGGNGDSRPCGISTNGQYALFESDAGDLVPGDTNDVEDVFVRDMLNGTTALVSVGTNGVVANGDSHSPVITPDGRYVAFVSDATDLVANDTNGISDVFVRDLQNNTTALASVGAMSANSSDGLNGSESPVITPDGRFVAFYSSATNLVPNVPFIGEVYARDMVSGTTTWVSTNGRSLFQSIVSTLNAVCCDPRISADGKFIAFEACATNLSSSTPFSSFLRQGLVLRYNLQSGTTDVVGTNTYVPFAPSYASINDLDMTPDGRFVAFVANNNDSASNTAIYLWDAQTETNTLVSADLNGEQPTNGTSDFPVVNPTGQYVAFLSDSTNLTANPLDIASNVLFDGYHLYLRNVLAGTTELVDADTNDVGIKVDNLMAPGLSDDGSLVCFARTDGGLVANDSNNAWDVFVRHAVVGTNELVSVHAPGLPALAPNNLVNFFPITASTNGRYVAFASEADDLVSDDTNGYMDVFVHDMLLGTNIQASHLTNTESGGFFNPIVYKLWLAATEPRISGNGRFVAFYGAPNVAHTQFGQIFLYDLQTETTELVSSNISGNTTFGFSAGNSTSPMISNDGRYVLFQSTANHLVVTPLLPSGIENLYLHDRQADTSYALTAATAGTGIQSASMTPDGHFVAFIGVVSDGGTTNLYVWNSELAQTIYTNTSVNLTNVSISPDGNRVAYTSGSTLLVYDFGGDTNYSIASGNFNSRSGFRFSADGRFLVFATDAQLADADTNGTSDVYLHDFQTGTNLLVSRSFNSSNAGDGFSDSPVITPDGRFIAYRSAADDLVPGDLNGVPDIFLYDRTNNATALISVNQAGNGAANARSLDPVFAGNGTLIFRSWASDLPNGDFNGKAELFAFNLADFPVTDSSGTGSTNSNSAFAVQLISSGPAQSPELSWPLAPGKTYEAQFKDDLTDPVWQDVDGSILFLGGTGYIYDQSPSSQHRFYRVLSSN